MEPSSSSVQSPSAPRRILNVSSLFIHNSINYLVTLGSDSITWRRQAGAGKTHSVLFSNCLDVRRDLQGRPKNFNIFYCEVPETPSSDPSLKSIEFQSLIGEDEADSWVELLQEKIFGLKRGTAEPPKRNITVLINPFGGTGSGRDIWRSVLPILKAAPLNLNVIETTSAGFGENYVRNLDFDQMKDGLVTVSGDGLLNEALNGLLKRPDWEKARQIPIGVIPAGSGNGVSAAVGALTPKRAAFHIAKGFSTPLDVWSVVFNNKRLFSLLSVEWALLAAVDFESEAIRFVGGARFTIWAVKKVVDGEIHSGLIAWTDQPPSDDSQDIRAQDGDLDDSLKFGPPLRYLPVRDINNWQGAAGDFVFFLACNVSHISTDVNAAPRALFSDGFADLLMMRKTDRGDLMKFLLDFGADGQHVEHPNLQYVKCRAFVLRPKPRNGTVLLGVDGEEIAPTTDLQVEVHQSLCSIFCAPQFGRPL